MTVVDIKPDVNDPDNGEVACMWFEMAEGSYGADPLPIGEPHYATFRSEALTLQVDNEEDAY